MAQLKDMFTRSLSASTLVEVLIALVIMLTVFAIGMVIFVRVNNAENTQRKQHVHMQLRTVSAAYLRGTWDKDQTMDYEACTIFIEEYTLPSFSDRRKIVVYAQDNNSEKGVIIDSLVKIIPTDEK